jgi:hypothetical protein
MPVASPQAQALTRQHRAELKALAAAVSRSTRAVTARIDATAVADWWAAGADVQVERIAAKGHRVAAALGGRYLRQHAALSGATVEPLLARFDAQAARNTLWVNSVAAFLDHMRATDSIPGAVRVMNVRLTGTVQYLALAGERDTITGTFEAGR